MKGFLTKIAVFAMLVVILAAAGELIVRRLPDSYSLKNDRMEADGYKVATLILGNSQTYYGLRPDLLGDSTFSLANVSQTPEYDFELLRRYPMPRLRRVIVNASYFTFREPPMEQTGDWFRTVKYVTRMGVGKHASPLVSFELYAFDAFCGQLRGLVINEKKNRCDSLGFGLGYTLQQRDGRWRRLAADRAEANTYPPSPERAAEVLATFREMAAWCRSRGIDPVMVIMPIWHGERELYDASQLAEMRALTGQSGFRVIDLMESPEFTDDDFFNSDHLAAPGAAHASTLLRRLL